MKKNSLVVAIFLFLLHGTSLNAQTQSWMLGDYSYPYLTYEEKPVVVTYRLQLKPNGVCRMTNKDNEWETGWYRINKRRICVSSKQKGNTVGWFNGKSIIFDPAEFWGNVNTSGGDVYFSKSSVADKTPPNIAFSSPRQGQMLSHFRDVSGWVKDETNGSGISRVIVRLQRRTQGRTFHWNGYNWRRSSRKIPGANSGFGYLVEVIGNRWRFSALPSRHVQSGGHGTPPIGPKLFSGLYKFTATVYDWAGNTKSIAMPVRVKADIILPTVSIQWPQSNAILQDLPLIRGTARDSGGSGLDRVEVALWRRSDDKVWSGKAWARIPFEPPHFPTVLSAGRWQITKALPTRKNWPDGEYTVIAYAYDRAGNRNGLRYFKEGKHTSGVDERLTSIIFHIRRAH